MTRIVAYAVPPEHDEAFIAAWERARAAAGAGAATLHRALLADAPLRFVPLARGADAPAGEEAVIPFPSHGGAYEVVRERGAVDASGGVLRIELFRMPEDGDEPFLAAWDRAARVLADQQGHIGARLHRSTGPADFRFVAVARWSSPLMVARALRRAEVAAAVPAAAHAALYQAVGD
ncbi:MAG TPA: antibiotic biosynthesis monooxygenase [Solirubrobacteraceae bacterium]|nr:antibiotic biosynthesis monooxygenase [Solirubrobacteraceae bacterium]